tara:strand:+ start:365 stop:577 length:213 start_codon:yes stop_codon:yes gene_type:complete
MSSHDRATHLGAPVWPLLGRAMSIDGDDDGRILLGPARRLHGGGGVEHLLPEVLLGLGEEQLPQAGELGP